MTKTLPITDGDVDIYSDLLAEIKKANCYYTEAARIRVAVL